MPTVLWCGGIRIAIHTNDHRPPHIHAIGNGCEAVFVIDCEDVSVALRENYGFALRELRNIEHCLLKQFDELCREWEMIHGHP